MPLIHRFLKLATVILFSAFIFFQAAHAQTDAPYIFTVLGPDGVVARVITREANCPEISIDGKTSAMQVRAAPDNDFPITVCDALLPKETQEANVLGQALKLPKAKPERVLVIGDTGCRLKGKSIQECNDPAAWPFAPLADTAANQNADLIIHVGDYHYRESPCPPENAGCAGSPFGDNWAAWNADLFAPARNLLPSAPWVFVVGNHEDCERAGIGFFRMLDPRPMPTACPPYTDPYAINYVEPQLIVMDNSNVNDYEIEPEQLAAYTKQFEQINQMAHGTTWLLMHDPMYVFGHAGEENGQEKLFQDQPTLQQASNNTFPPSVQTFISGHIHLFEVLSFGQGRPPQLVVGNSGTLLDPPVTTPLTGLEIAGMKVAHGTMLDKFGFVVMERAGENWSIALKDVAGGELEKCVLGNSALLCGQTALPATGAEMGTEWWLVVALVGVLLVLGGLALAARSARRD